jgi:flagellar basal body-associated protein FliL
VRVSVPSPEVGTLLLLLQANEADVVPKDERNERVRAQIKNKVEEYLGRAEKIKLYLNSETRHS